MNPSAPARRSAAFTLIELLTVIAIIGILAAILIPTVGKVRQMARQTTCASRLRECGTAIQLWVAEHKERLPDPEDAANRRWPQYLVPYVVKSESHTYGTDGRISGLTPGRQNGYAVPVFRDPLQEAEFTGTGHGIFGYNTNLNRSYPNSTLKNAAPVGMGKLSQPSRFILMATTEATTAGKGGGIQLETDYPSPLAAEQGWSGSTNARGPAPLFGNKAMFLFADGHVTLASVCTPGAWPWNDEKPFDVK